MTRGRRQAAMAAAVLAGVLAISACSHGSGSPGGLAVTSHAAAAGGVARPAAASQASEVTNTSRIRTAELTVAVAGSRNVAGRADRAGVLAENAGGEVDRDDRSAGSHAQADLVLRVPPGRLVPVLTQLSALGHETSRQLASTDVTERVADVTSRVVSAQKAIVRLRALYASAAKVSDVIAIEGESSSREADLESLQAQQRSLARQTSMATITLTLLTAARPVAVPARHRSGFVGGLQRGWVAFTSAAAAAAAGAGAALPFLVLLLVFAALVRLAWRSGWVRRRTGPGGTGAQLDA